LKNDDPGLPLLLDQYFLNPCSILKLELDTSD